MSHAQNVIAPAREKLAETILKSRDSNSLQVSSYCQKPLITQSKMVYWRELGLNYLRFSQIAARELRLAIKPQAASKYPGQGEASIKRYGSSSDSSAPVQKEATAKK